MDYRGIITRGYHNDAGGQTAIRIVSQGYVGTLVAVTQIINVVQITALFQIKHLREIMFGKKQTDDSRFTIVKKKDILF